MDCKRNKKILLEILKCQTSAELEKIVKKEELDKEGWFPYGDRENNVGTVDGQMKGADNALMEKITNSIDAILMRRCYEEGIDPRNKETAPKTTAEAAERFFTDRESLRKERSKFAQKWLRITAEGKRDKPTITIIDRGEGQQPNKIKETILSLNKDIKEKIPFVYGTYNQGGASPLGFAGASASFDLDYLQLVLCRRCQTIKDEGKTENHAHFGFTIVRRRFDYDANKHTYEYLAEKDTKDIFSFPAGEPVEPVKIDDYEFEEGCVVKLYDYSLTPPGNIIFKGLNEFIERKLPESPLPIYLKELRNFKGGKDYSVFGLKERFLRKKELIRKPYPTKLPVDLGPIGKKEVQLFILKHKTETQEKLSDMRQRVFFIKDGLVLHTENMSWLRNECDLSDLSPYIYAFIDISTINPPLACMLHSGREKFKEHTITRLAINHLKIFFANEDLKKLDKEYGKLSFSSESALKDEILKKELIKEVKNQPELRKFFDLGEDFPSKEGEGDEPLDDNYEGTYLPEKFDLVGTDPKEIEDGSYCKISFDTGADTKLFERCENRGEYDWKESENFQVAFSSFKNGRLTFRIDPNQGVGPPQKEILVFFLRVPSKNIKMKGVATVLLKEKIPYKGKEYPEYFTPPKKVKIAVDGGMTDLRIQTDATNDYFDRELNPGTIKIKEHSDIEFRRPRLRDGALKIKICCKSKEVKETEDIEITIKDNRNEFNLAIPIKIVLLETEPQANLPKLEIVERENWNSDTPEWDENVIARIPSWNDIKRIKINKDSQPFDELIKIPADNRDAARKTLLTQIYINSIRMFLEFKDIKLNDSGANGVDIKDEIFEKAIRAASKMTIQNIKKLIR